MSYDKHYVMGRAEAEERMDWHLDADPPEHVGPSRMEQAEDARQVRLACERARARSLILHPPLPDDAPRMTFREES